MNGQGVRAAKGPYQLDLDQEICQGQLLVTCRVTKQREWVFQQLLDCRF